jgi:ppGpp synthetase/RelA/SpoT-type nucleotidyltranferase
VRKGFDVEYARAVELLPAFGGALESLLEDLLAAGRIKYHGVNHRVKSKESAERKMARPVKGENDTGPRSLQALNDLLGIRIITYFRDEVDAVAKMIEREFVIDPDSSVDKRAVLDADRFGYLSLHYVAKLSSGRVILPEYQKYDGIKFEVQIRSILQHAWAEIEHDLGYKSEAAVPRAVRRRFSRLAGVLELADDEFMGIRQEIGDHQAAAQVTITQGSFGIEIDQDSLSAFVQSSPRTAQLDKLIARYRNAAVQKRVDKQFLGRQAGHLVELGFHSIEDLSNYLDEQGDLLARFTQRWLSLTDRSPRTGTPVPAGITLYYAGALKYTQELIKGNMVGAAYSANNPDLLRQALRAADTGSPS